MRPHRYRVFIKATPEQVWQGIVDPAFTRRYFHGTEFLEPPTAGWGYRTVIGRGTDDERPAVEGTIEVAEPPSRLVMTWRVLYDAAMAEEPPSRVEWTITPAGDGLTRLDVVHGDLARSPLTWASVKDGWVWILDSLKTLLESGAPLPDEADRSSASAKAAHSADDIAGDWHRTQGIDANNSIWDLLGKPERTPAENEDLLRRAYAAAYHWQRATGRTPINEARALYMIAKAHLAVDHAELALEYGELCLAATQAAPDAADFDHAYAHEARARGLYAVGRTEEAKAEWGRAHAVEIADPEDAAIVTQDFSVALGEPV